MHQNAVLKKITTIIRNPKKVIYFLCYKGLFNFLPDKTYITFNYNLRFKKKLNLKNPVTFNEKLQWLKLYDRRPEYTTMVDKYEVKQYIAEKLGQDCVIETLGVWDKFEDIDFDSLPNQFVLKCTHDSGGLAICHDKASFDFEAAKKKINKSLKNNYYFQGREWPYKNVEPRIIAEKFMKDRETDELRDYKFFCFSGEAKCINICTDRSSPSGVKMTYFDRDWKVLPFIRKHPNVKEGLPKPKNYEKMLEACKTLASDIPFVRVDFYEVDGQMYFGELTFFPTSGMQKFNPEEWDKIWGDWITLPEKK